MPVAHFFSLGGYELLVAHTISDHQTAHCTDGPTALGPVCVVAVEVV